MNNVFVRMSATLLTVAIAAYSVPYAAGQAPQTPPQQFAKSAARAPSIPSEEPDVYFKQIYRDFYNTYKLGPEDQIAVRVQGQPDYSLEQVTISPVGRIYHPLLGDVDVAGLTVPKLTERLTLELSAYIIDPKVSLSLLTANSAKIGVVGEVVKPGILVMTRPMTILDAISASGGVSDFGAKSDVTVLRQMAGGQTIIRKVNVKRILEGKGSPEENLILQAGDTIIVHGNTRKKLANISSMMGFGSFLWFIRSL